MKATPDLGWRLAIHELDAAHRLGGNQTSTRHPVL